MGSGPLLPIAVNSIRGPLTERVVRAHQPSDSRAVILAKTKGRSCAMSSKKDMRRSDLSEYNPCFAGAYLDLY